MNKPVFDDQKNATSDPTLGTYCQKAFPSEKIAEITDFENVVNRRFLLQSAARKLLPNERVAKCLNSVVPGKQNVEIWNNAEKGKAQYKNLIVCGRRNCPVCAPRIAEQRRKELAIAITNKNLHAYLVTFTLQHNIHDDLKTLVDALANAFQKFKQGRAWMDLISEYYVLGYVYSWETTYTDNGWHPHIHVLMLTEKPLDTFAMQSLKTVLKRRWLAMLEKQGRDASWERGLDIQSGNDYLAEYLSKFGHEPALNADKPRPAKWTIEDELTKGHTKNARFHGRTPFALLADYHDKGDTQAGALFVEWSNVFKGKHHLRWSNGLKDYLGIDDIDDETAAQTEYTELDLFALIGRYDWYQIRRLPRDVRGDLLIVAAAGDQEAFFELVAELLEPDPTEPGTTNINPVVDTHSSVSLPSRWVKESRLHTATKSLRFHHAVDDP